MVEHKFKVTTSELRGIFLVILGAIALGYYYLWWIQVISETSYWLILGFIAALFYSLAQIFSNWMVYLGTHHRRPHQGPIPEGITVDVFVTAYKEPFDLVERCLTAACAIEGTHKTWLLDDGNDPALAELTDQLGAGYLTRQDRVNEKAGNVNAALKHTDGDIIIIFDIDHLPAPDFINQTLPCFSNPEIGFVQVMPTFSNDRQGWVARASTETSFDFYNPTSLGMDAFHSVTKMGTNSLIRREALESIGGYQPGLAEDLATSIALHAAGWRSRYVPEPLAPGLAPPDLSAWYTQQFKWARGVFEVLLTSYPRLLKRLTWGQRLSYAVRTTNYLLGPAILVHLVAIILVLFSRNLAAHVILGDYFIHLAPLIMIEFLIRSLAFRKWRHPSITNDPTWRALILIFVTWPIYTLAWLMAVLRLPVSFRPTPKTQANNLNRYWLYPQLVSSGLLLGGLVYSISTVETRFAFFMLYFLSAVLAVLQLSLLRTLLRPTLQKIAGELNLPNDW